MLLETIQGPNDIKKLDAADYEKLAQEIRDFLIQKVSEHGGHLASNLGVVELTMALHLVLNLPKDEIVWDVGHQAYTHKLLTGRREGFDTLRTFGGMSGFPKRKESECDCFNTGHSSTSISAACGLLEAKEQKGEDGVVVAVIGDGAMTGGMAYEGLNNIVDKKGHMIIILNDNEMSISPNVGGMSQYLLRIRSSKRYNAMKLHVQNRLKKVPGCGEHMIQTIRRTKSSLKQLLIPGMLFENMGISYWGPVDGHNIGKLVDILQDAVAAPEPVLIHVLTQKGKGYHPAESHPEKFHGVAPFEIKTGKCKEGGRRSYTDIFGESMVCLGKENKNLVAITAAMEEGTGLSGFHCAFPERFYDVGIAEQHAVTFAAGLAAGGIRPVVAIYSSFLQRAYDQILHDVALQHLPVIFAVDRAGIVGSDGETHQGVFDLSYLSSIPGMAVLAPKNGAELVEMLRFSCSHDGPIAIRYPRGAAYEGLSEFQAPVEFGKSELIYEESDIAILALGSMMEEAEKIRNMLKASGSRVTLVNARFAAPIDRELLRKLAQTHKLFVTMEENVKRGGYGEAVASYVMEQDWNVKVLALALPDAYIPHGTRRELLEQCRMDVELLAGRIWNAYNRLRYQ